MYRKERFGLRIATGHNILKDVNLAHDNHESSSLTSDRRKSYCHWQAVFTKSTVNYEAEIRPKRGDDPDVNLRKEQDPEGDPQMFRMHKNTIHHNTTKVTRNNSDPVLRTRWTRNHYFLHRLADRRPPITTGTIYLCATTYKRHRLDFRTAVSELTFRFLCRAHLYVRQSTMPSCYRHIASRLHCILLSAVASQKRRSSIEVMIAQSHSLFFKNREKFQNRCTHKFVWILNSL